MKFLPYLLINIFLIIVTNSFAQLDSIPLLSEDTLSNTELLADAEILDHYNDMSSLSVNYDSLYLAWFDSLQNNLRYVPISEYPFNDSSYLQPGPTFSDSVYMARLAAIESSIPLTYNDKVKAYIHVYTVKERKKLALLLGLADYYFPIFEQILIDNNLPVELKYLAIIESALNPQATSRVGASGLWQFMYATGKNYKLKIDYEIDERRDPIKSTYAAAHFLSDLYDMFGDWTLAIAAYNCGPGNVRKAIARTGGKRNFWDIYYRLPRETRGYVPAFIGAMYAMNYHAEHGVSPIRVDFPIATDTIHVNREIHMKQIAEVLDIPYTTLQTLNPQYRRGIIPAKNKTYALKIPADETIAYIELEDSIYNYKRKDYFDPTNRKKGPTDHVYYGAPPSNSSKILYTVKSGDNLGYIADWYDVGVSKIRHWNGIYRNSLIRVGQKIIIYVPKNQYDKYKNINSMSFEEKQKLK